MTHLFFLIAGLSGSLFQGDPDFEKLTLTNKALVCPSQNEIYVYYYMPSYLIVSEEYHEDIIETSESLYKFKVISPLTPMDIQMLTQKLEGPREYTDGLITFPLPRIQITLRPMPVQKIDVTLFKRRDDQEYDYSIPLEKIYFKGDLMHWAIPSHIILRVPLKFEPSLGREMRFQRVLPYQYEITVAPNITIPLYISHPSTTNKGVTHE